MQPTAASCRLKGAPRPSPQAALGSNRDLQAEGARWRSPDGKASRLCVGGRHGRQGVCPVLLPRAVSAQGDAMGGLGGGAGGPRTRCCR